MASVASPSDRTHIRLSGRAAGRLCQAPLAPLGDGQADRSVASCGASRSVGTRPRTHRTRVGMWHDVECWHAAPRGSSRGFLGGGLSYSNTFRENSCFPSRGARRRPRALLSLLFFCGSWQALSHFPRLVSLSLDPCSRLSFYTVVPFLRPTAREVESRESKHKNETVLAGPDADPLPRRTSATPARRPRECRVTPIPDRASQLTEVAESHLHDAQPRLLPLVW